MNRLKMVLSEAGRSITSNLSTSIAATMTVLIGMFLLGLLIALGTWVVSWSDHQKNQLEVRVFFLEDVSKKQANAVRQYLDGDPRVGSYEYVSKAVALERMRKRQPELVNSIPTNPFPASYEISPAKAEEVKALSRDIREEFGAPVCQPAKEQGSKSSGVECVRDGEQVSKRILQVARVIEVIFLVAVIVLLVASVLLIANTIRLSIFSRRREIEVMKLVGATNWFVRGPFMVEGLLCGAAGALAAIVLLWLGKAVALPAILGHIDTADDVRALAFSVTALILLGVGLGVGAVGSGLTLRRYLKV